MERNKYFGVNLLKGEYFRPQFNNNNSKLLEPYLFIETIITHGEDCINDMVGSYDVIATFTLRGDNKESFDK
jgi:hypothetical protein